MAEENLHRTWLHSDRFLPARFLRPVLRFTRIETAGGLVLLAAFAAALVWDNLPDGGYYHRFWETSVDLRLGPLTLHETLRGLVSDGLMTLFFFVVGLEIKREMVRGELRDRRTAALPVFAALGGMAGPALIYLAFAAGPATGRGWGIPVATDIAFSLGVLSLLGSRVPVGARLFLLTLAIADDIGGIVVIAGAYTEGVGLWWLIAALGILALVWGAGRAGVRTTVFYLIAGGACWLCLFESGVHPTLSGVALALLTPAAAFYTDEEYRRRAEHILADHPAASGENGAAYSDDNALTLAAVARESVAPLDRLQRVLHPWSSFVVVPLFALANSGIRFGDLDFPAAAVHPVALGTALGLVIGKLAGISGFAWLAVRLGWGRLPRGTGWGHVLGVAAVAGIGFTVALFITGLAFSDPALADRARLGIFTGSVLAGVMGFLLLRLLPSAAPHRSAAGSTNPPAG
ncbi:MAG: Na+/H+ antiporter NhaA [Actinobacteria bacterium]|nr:Na+/H+ antiporter NhaA [Actinomycetota bacterium]